MINKKLFKKGQGLPLNTIVIAILVIIVLLVIIVFFTSKMGDSGETLDNSNPTKCSLDNPALSTMGYTDVIEVQESTGCSEPYSRISTVPSWEEGEGDQAKTYICCGKKE